MKNYKMIVLADKTKWFAISEINYKNKRYMYLLGINDDEEDFNEQVKVVKHTKYKGEDYYKEITDENLLQQIIPLLIPEINEYLENPEKINELLEN